MPSTTSASRQSLWATGIFTERRLRAEIDAPPAPVASTTALDHLRERENLRWRPCAAAQNDQRLLRALPRIFAMASARPASTGGKTRSAIRGACFGVGLPQMSSAHSTMTGRWQPDSAADSAVCVSWQPPCGAPMRAANL